jgi:uncharacterized delta-60 repeat protein
MRNVYLKSIRLTLALLLIGQIVNAQVYNQGFISPSVLRQGNTRIIRQAPDGKLYVYGDFNFHGDRQIGNLVRLHPDGLLDASFRSYQLNGDGSNIADLEVLSNGNVAFIKIAESNATTLEILRPDGQIIKTIDPKNASLTAVEPDNTGGFFLAEYESVNQYSSSYTYVKRVAAAIGSFTTINDIQLHGSQLVVAGEFTSVRDGLDGSTQSRHLIARFDLNGHLDRSFNANTALAGLGNVQGVLVQPDGKILPLDHHTSYIGGARPIRLNVNGSLDTGFAYPFPSTLVIEDAHYLNGKLTIVTNRKIARLNTDGSLDPSFRTIDYGRANVIATVLPDESVIAGNYYPATYGFAKFSPSGLRINEYYSRLMRYGTITTMDRSSSSIFIGGDFIRVGNHFTKNVARLNLDGTVLTKFKSTITAPVNTVEALPNAKVLASTLTQIYRLGHDGALDPTFSYSPAPEIPYIRTFVVQPDGKVLVSSRFELIRLNTNGSRDQSFDAELNTPVSPNTVEFDLDRTTGKILYTNWQYPVENESDRTTLLRLNPNGTRDNSFNPPVFPDNFSSYGKALFLDNLEMLVVKPIYGFEPGRYDVVKLNPDGSINEQFADNAFGHTYGSKNAHRFGNRILLSRHTETSSEDPHTMTALFLDGTPDATFNMPLEVDRYTKYYSDNDTELFVIRDRGPNPLNKLTYSATSAIAGTSAGSAEDAAIRFYPNPVKNTMTVDVEARSTVNIFDGMGLRAISVPVDQENNTIDLNQLKPGRYVIEVMGEGKRSREHFVKE